MYTKEDIMQTTKNHGLKKPDGSDYVNIDYLNFNMDKIDSDIPFRFGIDENGNYGYYKEGADTVTPFKMPLPDNFTGFTSGTFTPEENVHIYTIAHGLGKIPDMVIVYPISGDPAANITTNGILIAGRELQNATGRQWYSYGTATFDVAAQRSERSIYGDYPDKNQGLFYADSVNMQITTYHGNTYYWCKDVTYRWMAFTQTQSTE